MTVQRITVAEAAKLLGVSPQFVRTAMQQCTLPIGAAVKMSHRWTYHISPRLLQEYSGKDVQTEIRKMRMEQEAM